jgi:hypothetical protein
MYIYYFLFSSDSLQAETKQQHFIINSSMKYTHITQLENQWNYKYNTPNLE